MIIIDRDTMETDFLPGRKLQRAVGKNSYSDSDAMTVGCASYSEESGVMEPHRHAEETVVIIDSKDGYVLWGQDRDQLLQKVKLCKGMILHIPENEWHAFTYDNGGFVDIIFIYGASGNIRPEDQIKK